MGVLDGVLSPGWGSFLGSAGIGLLQYQGTREAADTAAQQQQLLAQSIARLNEMQNRAMTTGDQSAQALEAEQAAYLAKTGGVGNYGPADVAALAKQLYQNANANSLDAFKYAVSSTQAGLDQAGMGQSSLAVDAQTKIAANYDKQSQQDLTTAQSQALQFYQGLQGMQGTDITNLQKIYQTPYVMRTGQVDASMSPQVYTNATLGGQATQANAALSSSAQSFNNMLSGVWREAEGALWGDGRKTDMQKAAEYARLNGLRMVPS